MVRTVRIYYTCYDEEENNRLIKEIEEILGVKAHQHSSRLSEFIYLEFKEAVLTDDKKRMIDKIINEVLGERSYHRIDYISL